MFEDSIREMTKRYEEMMAPFQKMSKEHEAISRQITASLEAVLGPARDMQATIDAMCGPAPYLQSALGSQAMKELRQWSTWSVPLHQSLEKQRQEDIDRACESSERSRELERSLQKSAEVGRQLLARDIAEAIVERLQPAEEIEEPEPKTPIGFGDRKK